MWNIEMLNIRRMIIIAVALLLSSHTALANDWEFIAAPYGLLAGVEGESSVGRVNGAPVDADFGDVLENLDIGFLGQFEALHRDEYGVFVDLIWMRLKNDDGRTPGGGKIEAVVDELLLQAHAFKRFNKADGFFDIYAGVKYWNIDLDIDVSGGVLGNLSLNRGDSWYEPTVGVRGLHQISEKWAITARADISGLVGDAGLGWNVQGGFLYEASDRISLAIQYRAIGVDYDNGKSGSENFAMDTTTKGPLVGVVIKF